MHMGICMDMCNSAEIGDGKYPSYFQNEKPEWIKYISYTSMQSHKLLLNEYEFLSISLLYNIAEGNIDVIKTTNLLY